MSDNIAKKPRILVADDVEAMLKLMSHILTNNGFEVETASDGEECLNKIETFQPDLIILDIMMPKLHGIDALKKIKTVFASHNVGVIICTAKDYKPDQDLVKELGAFDIIIKPFNHKEFLNKVRNYFSISGEIVPQKDDKTDTVSVEPYIPQIDSSDGLLRLWGTRGSMPIGGLRYARHGGNTSCVSIEKDEDIIIFDAGTGIRELGLSLLSQQKRKNIHLFITHTHWDHIQGFPFFAPAYIPSNEIVVYAASGFGKDLKSIFRGQLDRDYFPVQLEDMRATIEFKHLVESPVVINNKKIFWEYTNHPGATIGYKIDIADKIIGYISDNEFLKGYLGNPETLKRDDRLLAPHIKLIEFISDIDILLGEAQYTNEEYKSKIGWGHSSLTNACILAKLAGVKRWIIVHHDPMHDDEFLQKKLCLTKQIFKNLNYIINVTHGFDDMMEYL
ncbi:MAG: response regulator [Pseudomonadota bacterium]